MAEKLKLDGNGFWQRSGRISLSLAVLLSSVAMAGCSTPYLHDDAVETHATAVKEAYGKIGNDAYFTELRTGFASLQAQEDAARTESLLATRDRHLTRAIKPTDLYSQSSEGRSINRGPATIRLESAKRIAAILGACPEGSDRLPLADEPTKRENALNLPENICAERLGSNNLTAWSRLPQIIANYRSQVVTAQAAVATKLKDFITARDLWRQEAEKKRKDEKGKKENDLSQGDTVALTAAKDDGGPKGQGKGKGGAERKPVPQPKVKLDCEGLVALPADISKAPEFAAYPTYPSEKLRLVRHECVALDKALADMKSGGRLYRLLTPQGGLYRSLADKANKAREDRAKAQAGTELIAATIKRLEEQIKQGSPEPEFASTVEDLRDALANTPRLARLAGSKGVADFLEDILKAELSAATGDNAAADETQAAAAGAEAAEEGESSPTTRRAEAILALGSAFEQLNVALRLNNRDQRISGLILAIAAERQNADMLAILQQRETDRLALLESQELALLTETALLSEALSYALRATDKPEGIVELDAVESGPAVSALNRYALSWSEGRIPFELLEQRHVYLDREFRIRMAQRTATNWQNLIQPAINQMHAAGTSGVEAEVIAGLAGRLGIGSAILEN